jgi:F420-non-reducing hydrogenase small subunit
LAKPKVAFYWCASCGGCEETVVDLDENILKVTAAVDIVLWPVALDFKKKDIEAMKDKEIAVSFINGAIRMDEHEEWVKLLRKKSGLVVAFGACACYGGIPGLANFWDKQTIFDRQFKEAQSVDNPKGVTPQVKSKVDGNDLHLPEFYDTVKTLNQTIDVDYYLPGCPPPANLVLDAVMAILEGKLPKKGSFLAPDKALCDTCPRRDSKPEKLSIKEMKRQWQIKVDPTKCFLPQGIFCVGPATRSGCGETCIKANQPCRGCMGPMSGVAEQGAKSLSMIASILGIDEEENMSDADVAKLIDGIADPAGTVYRFTLPSSLLGRKRM